MINDYKISILRGIYFSLMCPHPIASPSLYHKSYPPTLSSVPLPPSLSFLMKIFGADGSVSLISPTPGSMQIWQNL